MNTPTDVNTGSARDERAGSSPARSRARHVSARLVYPALFFGLFAILPIAIAREDKCTNTETAYMIAKRFTSQQLRLTKEDEPDFPWFSAGMAEYRGGCSHEVRSWFDRKEGSERVRTSYDARVHYDVLMNRWSLEDWREEARTALPRS